MQGKIRINFSEIPARILKFVVWVMGIGSKNGRFKGNRAKSTKKFQNFETRYWANAKINMYLDIWTKAHRLSVDVK